MGLRQTPGGRIEDDPVIVLCSVVEQMVDPLLEVQAELIPSHCGARTQSISL